jgi:hypothetical protein
MGYAHETRVTGVIPSAVRNSSAILATLGNLAQREHASVAEVFGSKNQPVRLRSDGCETEPRVRGPRMRRERNVRFASHDRHDGIAMRPIFCRVRISSLGFEAFTT